MNLEPCAHLAKRTPPCAPALAAAGVRRVVVAMRDPNPAVSGRGLALLRRAGIAVTNGVLGRRGPPPEPAASWWPQVKQRPFVLLKAALTLDGRIATAPGDSKWITTAGAAARGPRACAASTTACWSASAPSSPTTRCSCRRRAPGGRSSGSSSTRACASPCGAASCAPPEPSPVLVLWAGTDARRRAASRRGASRCSASRGRAGRVSLAAGRCGRSGPRASAA